MRPRLLNRHGVPYNPPTLLDFVRESLPDDGSLRPIVEVLCKKNQFLQDKPWVAKISPIVDSRGQPILHEVK